MLGTPLGHADLVRAQLDRKVEEHQELLRRIPTVPDLQSAWLHLLHCAAAKATYLLRVLPPDSVAPFAPAHDEGLWQCFCKLLDISPDQHHVTRTMTTLPVALGGLGLRSARRTSQAAYWASWAYCLQMIQERQPEFAAQVVRSLEEGVDTPALNAAAIELTGVMGFAPPSRSDLALGARPPPREAEDLEPGAQRPGWQHEASSRVERRHRSVILFPHLTEADKALTRSQSGTGAGVALTTTPSKLHTRIKPQLFRVLLFRRLRLPLQFLDASAGVAVFLTHLATTMQLAGVFGRRSFALESAAAKICREAGGRVATNLFVRDLDVNVPNLMDNRRLEVVADVLLLLAGAQLAVDTTLVCPLHADGTRHRRASTRDGAVLVEAWRRKERTYPELLLPGSRARLVVLALETGGRWSEALAFVRLLAKAKARSEPQLMRKRVEQAWRFRWLSLLGCAAARSFASSLLELRGSGGSDGPIPSSHEVEGDHCRLGL